VEVQSWNFNCCFQQYMCALLVLEHGVATRGVFGGVANSMAAAPDRLDRLALRGARRHGRGGMPLPQRPTPETPGGEASRLSYPRRSKPYPRHSAYPRFLKVAV
jgi:hypothetical protein